MMFNRIFDEITRYPKYIIVIWIILFAIVPFSGLFLFYNGLSDYNSVTFEDKTNELKHVFFLVDSNTSTIDRLSILLVEKFTRSDRPSGDWIHTIIEFNTTSQDFSLHISLPNEIESVNWINYTSYQNFTFESEYNAESDSSRIYVAYITSENESRTRIWFDWQISNKITYDKRRITIPFGNPYFGSTLFSEQTLLGGRYIPQINNLIIQIQTNSTLDASLTIPPPSYVYFTDQGETSVTWIFDERREVSSVQSVFQNLAASSEKDQNLFLAGLKIAFGSSMIIWGITEGFAILRKKLLKTAKYPSDIESDEIDPRVQGVVDSISIEDELKRKKEDQQQLKIKKLRETEVKLNQRIKTLEQKVKEKK